VPHPLRHRRDNSAAVTERVLVAFTDLLKGFEDDAIKGLAACERPLRAMSGR
jgi:hypothetical protein